MLKNQEGKEPDTFEQEMEYRITNLEKAGGAMTASTNAVFAEGMAAGYRYARAIYQECRRGAE